MGQLLAVLLIAAGGMFAQSPAARPPFDAFEVATIKPEVADFKGRYITLQGHQFVAKNHTVKTLVAAAYNLTPRAISGGPAWVESDHYDILAKPPGDIRPDLDEQMRMLRKLLADRFKLTFHRERKELPVYALTIAKGGPKLRPGTESPDGPKPLVFVLSPQGASMPGRNVTIAELASVMQRAALDRPVVDQTGLTERYDFDLEFAPSNSLFGGQGPPELAEPDKPDLFAAIQQQLGLKLEATKGPVETFVIDQVERPSEN
jgi:uncharacterized protein (TIGR03435 family)